MQWVTIIAGYFVVWWIVLFAVLPFGTRPAPEADATTGWRGAPIAPRFWRVVLATTLVAAIVWGGAVLVITSGWVSFRSGSFALQPQVTGDYFLCVSPNVRADTPISYANSV